MTLNRAVRKAGWMSVLLILAAIVSYWDVFFIRQHDLLNQNVTKVQEIDPITNKTLFKLGFSRGKQRKWSAVNINSADRLVTFRRKKFKCWAVTSMTVVTGFFNIGSFQKGNAKNPRNATDYKRWISAFSALTNPVIFFTDDREMKKTFENWRSKNPRKPLCTQAFLIETDDIWPWLLVHNISMALKSRPYLFKPPDSNNPSYDAATNSKYPLTELGVLLNPFQTEYFAWVDAGIFRTDGRAGEDHYYYLQPLSDLPAHSVGYLEIRRRPRATADEIFIKHLAWVAGGVFFGRQDAMLRLAREYFRVCLFYMQRNLVGADQQVLAAMFSASDNQEMGLNRPAVSLRLYNPYPAVFSDPWYYLANKMKKAN